MKPATLEAAHNNSGKNMLIDELPKNTPANLKPADRAAERNKLNMQTADFIKRGGVVLAIEAQPYVPCKLVREYKEKRRKPAPAAKPKPSPACERAYSGFKNISGRSANKGYVFIVTVNSKKGALYCGTFETLAEAKTARDIKRAELGLKPAID